MIVTHTTRSPILMFPQSVTAWTASGKDMKLMKATRMRWRGHESTKRSHCRIWCFSRLSRHLFWYLLRVELLNRLFSNCLFSLRFRWLYQCVSVTVSPNPFCLLFHCFRWTSVAFIFGMFTVPSVETIACLRTRFHFFQDGTKHFLLRFFNPVKLL